MTDRSATQYLENSRTLQSQEIARLRANLGELKDAWWKLLRERDDARAALARSEAERGAARAELANVCNITGYHTPGSRAALREEPDNG